MSVGESVVGRYTPIIITGALVVSTITVQTQSDLIPATGAAMRCFFQAIPTPPHPLERLHSGVNLLSVTAIPFILGH